METEEKIIWSIIDTIRETRANQDMNINERLLRQFLATYRAALIQEYSLNGQLVTDECFQYLGRITFLYKSPRIFTATLPKIIRLKENQGIYFEKNDEVIPIVDSEAFGLSRKNIITGTLPKAKIVHQLASIYVGEQQPTSCGGQTNPLNFVISDFNDEISFSKNATITVDVFAILQNPEDAEGYDWTSTVYPLPAELIPELKKRIMVMDFNIIIQNEIDNTTDGIDKQN